MKRVYLLLLAFVFAAFLFPQSGVAQDEKGHYFVVTTWKLLPPADGSNAQLDSLFTVYHDKVVAKNDKVVSQKVMHHVYGDDMRDWVVISEYASWNDIDAAGDVSNKLIKEAWPDKAERQKFFKTFFKYVQTHSDEIYQDMPGLTK